MINILYIPIQVATPLPLYVQCTCIIMYIHVHVNMYTTIHVLFITEYDIHVYMYM